MAGSTTGREWGAKVAQDFDPYYKWLGIPPKDQPADHYRLLGLTHFESDPQVIEAAADRQMTFVRTFQNGPHTELSQQLLNELAAAKLTLLRPDKRTAYDTALRGTIAAKQATAQPQPTPPIAAPQSPMPLQQPVAYRPVHYAVAPQAPVAQQYYVQPNAYAQAALPEELIYQSPVRRHRKSRSQLPVALMASLLALSAAGYFFYQKVIIPSEVAEQAGVVVANRPAANHSMNAKPAAVDPAANKSGPAKDPASEPGEPAPGPAQVARPMANEKPAEETAPATAKKPDAPQVAMANVPNNAPAVQPLVRFEPLVANHEKIALPAIAHERLKAGEMVDLLNSVSAERDSLLGKWQMVDGELVSPAVPESTRLPTAAASPLLQLPRVPGRSTYRLGLEVMRVSGTGPLLIVAVVQGKPVTASIDSPGHTIRFATGRSSQAVMTRAWEFPNDKAVPLNILVSDKIYISSRGFALAEFATSRLEALNDIQGQQPDVLCIGAFSGAFKIRKIDYTEYGSLAEASPPQPETEGPQGRSPPIPLPTRFDAPVGLVLTAATDHINSYYPEQLARSRKFNAEHTVIRSAVLQARDGARNVAESFALYEYAKAAAIEMGSVTYLAWAIEHQAAMFKVDFNASLETSLPQAIANASTEGRRKENLDFLKQQVDVAKQRNNGFLSNLYSQTLARLAVSGNAAPAPQNARVAAADNALEARQRLPLPTENERLAALEDVKKQFADDYASQNATARIRLAQTLSEQAKIDTYSPAERFVMRFEASELLLEVGELNRALTELDYLDRDFDVDLHAQKLDTAKTYEKSPINRHAREALVEVEQERAAKCLRAEKFAQALEWIEQGLQSAKRLQNSTEFNRELNQLRKDANDLGKLRDQFDAAQEKLKAEPADKPAKFMTGRYVTFVRDKWSEGLPFLAAGGDKGIGEAARLDLATAGDANATLLLAVADAWFALGESSPTYTMTERNAMRQRATYWYQLASPKLSGNDKTRATQRAAKYPRTSDEQTPAVRKFSDLVDEEDKKPVGPPAKAVANKPLNAPAGNQAVFERRMAEWAMAQGSGGHVRVKIGNTSKFIRSVAELPAEPFTVDTMWIGNFSNGLGPEFLSIPQLTALSELSLFPSRQLALTDVHLRTISSVKSLTSVHLSNVVCATPQAMIDTLGTLPNLKTVYLSSMDLSLADFRPLLKAPALRSISLYTCRVPVSAARVIATMPAMETVIMTGPEISDSHVAELRPLRGLEYLNVSQASVTDRGLANLAAMPRLRTIDVSRTAVTDQSIATLASLPSLTLLLYRDSKITPDGLARLRETLPKLRTP